MIVYDLPDANDFVQEFDLDNQTFFLVFSWNSACQLWTMSIQNANRMTLVAGIRLIENKALLADIKTFRLGLPLGDFCILRINKDPEKKLDREAFTDQSFQFIYMEAAENGR